MATREEILELKASQKIPQKEFIRLLGERSQDLVNERGRNEQIIEALTRGPGIIKAVEDWNEKFKGGKFIQKPEIKDPSTYAKLLRKMLREDGELLGDFFDRLNNIFAQDTVKIEQLQNRNTAYEKEQKLIEQQLAEMPEIFPAPPAPGQPSPGDSGFD